MITLEQVQKLDAKIKQAVGLISTLREENAQLRSALSEYEIKVNDLEKVVTSLEDGQISIEKSLIDAISVLDNLEIVENKNEEASEELSLSEETEIVKEEIIHEDDHSKQAENTPEDFLEENIIESKEDDSEIVEPETTEALIEVSEPEETEIEKVIEAQDEPKSDNSNDKKDDYSIPMLEIF